MATDALVGMMSMSSELGHIRSACQLFSLFWSDLRAYRGPSCHFYSMLSS